MDAILNENESKQITGVKYIKAYIFPVKKMEIPAVFVVDPGKKTVVGYLPFHTLNSINLEYIAYHVAPSVGLIPECIDERVASTVFSKNDVTPYSKIRVIVTCNEVDEFDERKGLALAKKKLCRNIRRSLSKTLMEFSINIRKLANKAEEQSERIALKTNNE